jgi:hypothetical protein
MDVKKKLHVKFWVRVFGLKGFENNLNLQNEELFPISLLHVHTFESTQNTSVNISIKKPRTKLD